MSICFVVSREFAFALANALSLLSLIEALRCANALVTLSQKVTHFRYVVLVCLQCVSPSNPLNLLCPSVCGTSSEVE